MADKPKEQDATKSLCYTCKHGLCFKQNESATIQHMGMPPGMGGPPQSEDELSPFEMFEQQNEASQQGPMSHEIEMQRVISQCYYQVEGFESDTPFIHLGIVNDCNRHEEDEK